MGICRVYNDPSRTKKGNAPTNQIEFHFPRGIADNDDPISSKAIKIENELYWRNFGADVNEKNTKSLYSS